MKQFSALIVMALASSMLLTGCSKQEETPPPVPAESPASAAPAPTTPATTTPPVAEAPKAPENVVDLVASAKDGVAQAMALAQAGKYQEALTLLQQKATEVQSNPDAMKIINDATAQVKKMMADAATKAATDKVGGALGGLGK